MTASSRELRGVVVAVSRSEEHSFAKANRDSVRLIAGLGVEGDAHAGATVKHRSRVARNPLQPNLRQVHLIHDKLLHDAGELVRRAGVMSIVLTGGVVRAGDPIVVDLPAEPHRALPVI